MTVEHTLRFHAALRRPRNNHQVKMDDKDRVSKSIILMLNGIIVISLFIFEYNDDSILGAYQISRGETKPNSKVTRRYMID